jgi:hypothetical protein
VVGGLAGAGVGVMVWGVDDSATPRHWLPTVAIGLAAGGGAGAVVGSGIGAAFPKWRRVYSADAPGQSGGLAVSFAPSGVRLPRSEPIGSATLALGYNKAFQSDALGGALGGHTRLAVELGAVSPSLEVGRYGLGGRDVATPYGKRHYEESLFHLGPAVSVGPARGAVRPYALAGFGYYRWQAFSRSALDPLCAGCDTTAPLEFLGGNLGGGVRVRAARGLSLGVEGRWHTNVSSFVEHERLSLLSLTAGATLTW